MSIKPPSPSILVPTTNQPTTPISTPQPANVINPEAVAVAVKEYNSLQKKLKKPLLKGASGLFTDNIVFHSDLLDSTNPATDPKYLHLLLAVLNLKDLARFFAEPDQIEEELEELEE